MDAEGAEIYLRLMAEAGVRDAMAPGPGGSLPYLRQMRYVAAALTLIGAVDPDRAETVLSDLEAALTIRSREHRGSLVTYRGLPGVWVVRSQPKAPEPAQGEPEHGDPLQAVPVGRKFRVRGGGQTGELWLLSVIRTPARMLMSVTGRNAGLTAGRRLVGSGQLRTIDDRGNSYHTRYYGSGAVGEAMSGWLFIEPALPPDAPWVELHSSREGNMLEEGDFIRVDLTAKPAADRMAVEPAEPVSLAERLLDAAAEGLLAKLPSLSFVHECPDELVAALEAAGALPPGSPAASRLGGLCQQARLDIGYGLVAALEDGSRPAAELPEPWTSMLAYFGRRHRPAGRTGVAPMATVLPEIDGIRFVLTGLRSDPDLTLMIVVAMGLPGNQEPFGMAFIEWFPWWIRDSAGQWHLAEVGSYDRDAHGGTRFGTLGLRLTPPLTQSVTWLEVIARGRFARVRAIVPVNWAAGHD